MIKAKHPAYKYARDVVDGRVNAPKYVKLQCIEFLTVAKGRHKKYKLDDGKIVIIENVLKLMIVAKGLKAGQTFFEVLAGFQWLFIIAILCTVYRDDPSKRRYETAVLEICRKNGKTALIGVLFILLFLTEPRFSKFYSVAPNGALSREVKTAIEETIQSSPALRGTYENKQKFKILRDYIHCNLTDNRYIPLNYSNSTLDGKLPSVFLVDETGALPNPYAIEAMRSGQLTILNKLGCIISTKYPTVNNPFEDEVEYAKKVLNKLVVDDKIFALLFEPDNKKDWATDDEILEHGNPLALELPAIMKDLKDKRQVAIEIPSKRENFITKHCNIVYAGEGTESFVSLEDVRRGKRDKIDWRGKNVYIGVDLSMSNDNCSVAMSAYESETQGVVCEVIAFLPEDKIEEKNKIERINYYDFIKQCKAIACGDRTVDYAVIEKFVEDIEGYYGVKIMSIGYDRYNALSSAQKWAKKYTTVEIRQHSSLLHAPTKWLSELIANGKFYYSENKLLEINFENARCTYDTNLNRYVNKKKSSGKVDMVVALINSIYLLQQDIILNPPLDFVVQY